MELPPKFFSFFSLFFWQWVFLIGPPLKQGENWNFGGSLKREISIGKSSA
jgi:hypothetical protein